MKNITIFLILCVACTSMFSQQPHFKTVLNTPLILNTVEENISKEVNNVAVDVKAVHAVDAANAFGTPILTDDFSNSSHWLMQNNASGSKTWTIGTIADADAAQLTGYSLAFNMWNPDPTTGNKFAYFDAVSYLLSGTVPIVIDVTLEYNGTLDFSSYQGVGIQWDQNYRAFNQDQIYFEYSVDGGSAWYPVGADEMYTNMEVNFYAPTVKYFNVSHEMGGLSNVKIRFRWSCNYTGSSPNSSGAGYGWMIDNVSVLGLDNNDLKTEKIFPRFYGLGNYTKFPYRQRQKLTAVKALCLNNGSSTQSDVFTYADVLAQGNTTPVFSALSSNPFPSLAVGDRDTLVTDTFTYVSPASLGTYIISCRNEQTEVENNPSDNLDTISFSVTDTVYARDRSYSGRFGPTRVSGATDGDFSTIAYYITSTDTVSSISVFIANGTKVNSVIQGVICYYLSGNSLTEQITTQNYTIQSSDIDTWVTLSFRQSYDQYSEILNAGTLYWAGIKYFWQTVSPSTKGIYIGTDKESHMIADDWGAGSNYYVKSSGTIYGHLSEVPKIRMNMAYPSELTNNNSIDTEVFPAFFPNPSNGIFNIKKDDISSVKISNLMGKIVFESNHVLNQIDLSDLAQGYYIARITKKNISYFQKINIVK